MLIYRLCSREKKTQTLYTKFLYKTWKREKLKQQPIFDLETIKEHDTSPLKQMILMQPAFSTHTAASYTTEIQSSAFTTRLAFYKIQILLAKVGGILG